MLKKKNEMEKGRSVADTLGGGALIGVLSLGGVYGYNHAMCLYREAETLDQLSVLVAGSRSFDIPLHFGELTVLEDGKYAPYIVPIREVVSKVNYRSSQTAYDAGLVDDDGEVGGVTLHDVREYESFDTALNTPVWVRAEDEKNWSVRITGLSYSVCEKLLQKHDLGFDYAYVAHRNDSDNSPIDPEYGDFSMVDSSNKYANPQKKLTGGVSTEKQIEKVCSMIDSAKGKTSLAQTYISNVNNVKVAGIAFGSDEGPCYDKKSLACMAYGARLYNPETEKKDIPLQTLVLHFGSGGLDSSVSSISPAAMD